VSFMVRMLRNMFILVSVCYLKLGRVMMVVYGSRYIVLIVKMM